MPELLEADILKGVTAGTFSRSMLRRLSHGSTVEYCFLNQSGYCHGNLF